jgi:hypothetical protein
VRSDQQFEGRHFLGLHLARRGEDDVASTARRAHRHASARCRLPVRTEGVFASAFPDEQVVAAAWSQNELGVRTALRRSHTQAHL